MATSPIREKVRLRVGGTQQGGFITGQNRRAPVLLFLHGGPGLPEYPLLHRYPTRIDEDFVVCWWDQRGAGLSYDRSIPRPVTEEQLITDAVEVTDYLRDRFGQEHIYLMAHSGGSHVGIQVAARAPDRFHAYVGMAQITRQLESEQLAWLYMRATFEERGNHRMVRKLDRFPIPQLGSVPDGYRGLRDTAMHSLGIGTTRQMRSVITGVFLPTLVNREYTIRERVDLWRGKWSATSRGLWHEMVAVDVTARVPRLDLPVYLLHGVHDLTVSYRLAREYCTDLDAPSKGFYSFAQSAHSPFIEEPDRTQEILRRDVLTGRTDLADGTLDAGARRTRGGSPRSRRPRR